MALINKLQSILAEHFGIDKAEVTLNALIIDDLGADSLDTLELVMQMEDEFNIEIQDGECDDVRTVGDMLDLVQSKLTSSATRP